MSYRNQYHENRCFQFKDLSRFVNTDLFDYCPFCSKNLKESQAEAMVELKKKVSALRISGTYFINGIADDDLVKSIKSGNKVQTIKYVREFTGCSLSEARDLVEQEWESWQLK